MFQERLPTLSNRCIKSAKLRQTNFIEFLDDFVMKKARTKNFLVVFWALFSLTSFGDYSILSVFQ